MDETVISTEESKNLSRKELMTKLSTGENGLTNTEAAKRLEKYGANEISERKVRPLIKFLSYFWGPIPWMIEIAALLSAVINHWDDFILIVVLLFVNVVVGFWQERKADNAIEALKEKLALESKVFRDGKWVTVLARQLVPGDVIRIRLGDRIPADIKLLKGDFLMIDESALTGESLPVEKHTDDVGYAGSIVRQGEMDAIVVTTGMNTFFGKTAKLIDETKSVSHFQRAIVRIGNYLIYLAAIQIAIIFVVSFIRHDSMIQTLQFALVLTVAAIPVALPAVLSVTMAIGAMSLAKKGAIVSRLVSIEEMAGMDILCSDKTGTITKNEISVAETVPLEGFSKNDVILYGYLTSREEDKDPIDDAIIQHAMSTFGSCKSVDDHSTPYKGEPDISITRQVIPRNLSVIEFKPFDPVSKRVEVHIKDPDNGQFRAAKGAPQSILSLMEEDEVIEKVVMHHVEAFANKGYRALGVARTDGKGKWMYVGLIALHDPPREDSAKTIRTAKSMGVNVKMVTGDHKAIAQQIARQVDLGTDILESSAIQAISDDETERIIERVDGFSQVFPEHKYHIVELLQDKGHIVGMTGDGVNDAPALKKADVGIAVAGATDAARSSASIVFTKPGLSEIIDSLIQSRKIFQRMKNYAIYRIAETIRVLIFITLSIILLNFYPVTALMIVLLALLNDGPIMTIAYDNVKYSNTPEKWNMKGIMSVAFLLGFIGIIESFIVLIIGRDFFNLSQDVLQSFIYLKLSVAGHLTVFIARTRGHFWTVKPALPLLFAVIITQMIATVITVYGILLPAMGWGLAIFIWIEALIVFVFTDTIQTMYYHHVDTRENTVMEQTSLSI